MNLTANTTDMFTEIHDEVYAVLSLSSRPLSCGEVCDGINGCGYSFGEVHQALKDLTAAALAKVSVRGKVLRYTSR